jgi:hypothetical protein
MPATAGQRRPAVTVREAIEKAQERFFLKVADESVASRERY